MFECIKDSPQEVFHYTLRSNVDSIINTRCIARYDDTHTWFTRSYDDAIELMKMTVLDPGHEYYDTDGIKRTVQTPPSADDYCILRLAPRHYEPMKWFVWHVQLPSGIDPDKVRNHYKYVIAYQGNLRVNVLEVMDVHL